MKTIVNEIGYSLIANIDNHERLLFAYPKDYEKITGCSIKDAYMNKKTNLIEGFLRITNGSGKKIYRRFRGCSVPSGSVYLGYRSMCELGLSNGDTITVEPTSWLKYYLYNSDTYVKYTVWIAIFGLLCTIVSMVISIIQIML